MQRVKVTDSGLTREAVEQRLISIYDEQQKSTTDNKEVAETTETETTDVDLTEEEEEARSGYYPPAGLITRPTYNIYARSPLYSRAIFSRAGYGLARPIHGHGSLLSHSYSPLVRPYGRPIVTYGPTAIRGYEDKETEEETTDEEARSGYGAGFGFGRIGHGAGRLGYGAGLAGYGAGFAGHGFGRLGHGFGRAGYGVRGYEDKDSEATETEEEASTETEETTDEEARSSYGAGYGLGRIGYGVGRLSFGANLAGYGSSLVGYGSRWGAGYGARFAGHGRLGHGYLRPSYGLTTGALRYGRVAY